MSYKIEVDYNSVELLIREVIVQDYKNLIETIGVAESNIKNLSSYELEDMIAHKRYQSAFETIMEYYLPESDRQSVLNAHSK